MAKKKLSIKTVVIISLVIGVFVVVIAYLALSLQQRKALTASREGKFPAAKELVGLQPYGSDKEGDHYYVVESEEGGTVRAWSKLAYTKEGREAYILRRKQSGIFTEGLDALAHRNILYEFRCGKDPVEFTFLEVYEVDRKGKTLDYARTPDSREWWKVTGGDAVVVKLAGVVCAGRK